ncbi:MAG: DUF4160 domain-containing protein [bacterium]
MPKISEFFGISIYMYFSDHNPPHLHARYGEFTAELDFSGRTLVGKLPPRVLGLVVEWITMHNRELMEDWELARKQAPLKPIKPLE